MIASGGTHYESAAEGLISVLAEMIKEEKKEGLHNISAIMLKINELDKIIILKVNELDKIIILDFPGFGPVTMIDSSWKVEYE